MAQYEVTAPNGNKYQVTAPEGATTAELREYVKRNHPNSLSGAVGKNYGDDNYQYKSPERGFWRKTGDIGTQLITGTERAIGSVVGLGSYLPGVHLLADPIANWFHNRADIVDEAWLSARQKELNHEIQTRLSNVVASLPEDASLNDYYDAMLEGGGEAYDFLRSNKGQVLNLIAQSVPYMVGGGAITKGLKGGAELMGLSKIGAVAKTGQVASRVLKKPYIGAAVGEGMIVGGDLVTQHIDETDSVGEYSADRLKTALAIPTTAGISMAGGKVAKQLKLADPDVAITGKVAYGKDLLSNKHMAGGLVRRTVLGAGVEGGEEFLQSGTEEMWGNVAAGRHPLVGIGGASVMGLAAGAGQGGGINLLGATADIRAKKKESKVTEANSRTDEKFNDLKREREQAEQDKIVEATEQQDLFNRNEDVLRNVINLVGDNNLNIAENIPGVDPEVINNLESPLDQALYYLDALKRSPDLIFESDDGKSKTNSENLIATFEKHIEALAPGVLASEAQADQIQAENESRRTHAATYPNEREWEKIVASEEFERLRIEISDRSTELGKLFTEWQDAPEIEIKGMHDTDGNGLPTESAVKLFIKDHPDLFPKGAVGTYVEALNEHARLEEDRLTRNEGVSALITDEIAKLVARRTQALADGNLPELKRIEDEVARRQSPVFSAEWLEAKRAITVKPKKETEKVEATGQGEVEVAPIEDTTEEIIAEGATEQVSETGQGELELEEQEQVEVKPKYPKAPKRQEKHEKAVSAFGDNYEKEWFGAAVVKKVENSRTSTDAFDRFIELQKFEIETYKMANALEDTEMRVLGQVPLGGMETDTWEEAVIPFLLKASSRGRLSDYGSYSVKGAPKTSDPEKQKKRVRGVDYELDHKSLTKEEKKKLNRVSTAKKPPTLASIIDSINKKRKAEKRPLLGPKTNFTINELKKPETTDTEGEEPQATQVFTWYNKIIAEELKELGVKNADELITDRAASKRIWDAITGYRERQRKFGESEQKEKALYDKLAPKGKDTPALRKENKKRFAAGRPPLVSRNFREAVETFLERTGEKIGSEISNTATISQIEPDTGLQQSAPASEDEDVELKEEIKEDATDERSIISTAAGSQTETFDLEQNEKEYVAKKAKEDSPEQLQRKVVLQKDLIKTVEKANANEKFLKSLKTEWTKQNKGDAKKGETVYLPYDQQPIEIQASWIWSVNVANSDRSRRQFLLASEFADTITAHSNTIKVIGDKPYEKTDSIPEVKSAELAEEKRKASKRKSGRRTTDDKRTAADAEKVLSKELEKVGRKKLTDRQRANAIKKLKARPIVERKGDKYVNIPLALKRHIDSLDDSRAIWEYSDNELVLQAKIAVVNMQENMLDKNRWTRLKGSDLNKFKSLKEFINKYQEKKGGDVPDEKKLPKNLDPGVIYSVIAELADDDAPKVEQVASMFRTLVGEKSYQALLKDGKIKYYDTSADALDAYNAANKLQLKEGRLDNTGAFVATEKDGSLDSIAFILSNMSKDSMKPVFMHEVGGHIGLQSILGEVGMRTLAKEIRRWFGEAEAISSGQAPGKLTLEQKIAVKTMKRVRRHASLARKEGEPLNQEERDAETIAYFIQGAWENGVRPNSLTAVGRILKKFKDAFLKFMGLARVVKKGNYKRSEKPNITAQDISDMAWGAAKLKLTPEVGYTWKTFTMGLRYFTENAANRVVHQAAREGLVDPVELKLKKYDKEAWEDPFRPAMDKLRKIKDDLRALRERYQRNPNNLSMREFRKMLKLEKDLRLYAEVGRRHQEAELVREKRMRGEEDYVRKPISKIKRNVSDEMATILSQRAKDRKAQLDAGVISQEEYDLAIKDIAYITENPALFEDTGQYFHGTSQPIEQLNYAPGMFNIYGSGLYTTMARSISYKYTKKGKGKTPIVYRVIEKHPGSTLNMELTPASFAKEALGDFYTELRVTPEELSKMSLREVIDEFRNESKNLMIPAHEVIETVDSIFDKAYRQGYKSVTHYGGRLSDGTKHRVKIFIHPAEDVTLEEDSIFWDKKIEEKIRRELPKNDRGKYIPAPGVFIKLEDYPQFQKDQWAKEKKLRANYESEVAELMEKAREEGPSPTLQMSLSENDKKRSKEEAARIEKYVEENFNDDMKGMWTTMKDTASKGARKFEFLHEQIYRNRREMPAGVVVGEALLAQEQLRNEIKQTADDIAVQARNLKPARLYLVNKTIAFGTIEGIWPADPKTDNKSVAKGNVTIDKGFQKLFEKELTTSEQKIVMDVYIHGIHLLEEYTHHLEAAVGKEGASSVLKLLETKGPYASLRRTGDHTVTLKSDKFIAAQKKLEKGSTSKHRMKAIEAEYNKLKGDTNHYIYTHFLTEGEARKFMKKEANTGNWASSDESSPFNEKGMRYQEKPPAIGAGRESDVKVLEKVYGALATSGLEKDTRRLVEGLVEGLFLNSLEEGNARQAMVRREGIGGYDENMLRSFVTNAKAQANLIANIAYGKEINVALSEAWKEAKEHPNDRTTKLYKELVFHYNLGLSGRETNIQDRIASFTTASMLTLNPSYHLQNLTQPWAFSYPLLAATFNDWKGVGPRLIEGYAVAKSIISYDGKIPFLGLDQVTWQTNVDVDNIPSWVTAKGISKEESARRLDLWEKSIKPLLTRLKSGNLLDLGIEQDLSENVNMKTTGIMPYDAANKFAGQASHRLFQVPRMVEAYNRISVAVAAHQMAEANPKVMEQLETTPQDFAVHIVRRTQGDFTASGAPSAIKWLLTVPGIGKLIAQFQKFRFLALANYIYAFNDSMKGATQIERQIGRRALTYLLAHTTVLGGFKALPLIGGGIGGYSFIHALFWVMSGWGDDEDDEILSEGLLERKIMEAFPDSPEFAKALARGAPYLLGLDLSTKLSHADLFDPAPFTNWSLTEDGFVELGFNVMTGASGSNAANIFKGLEFIAEDNYYRGVETIMPKGPKHMMESYRLATEGYSFRTGDPVVEPENFSTKSLMINALGLSTKDIGGLKWTRSEQFQIEDYFNRKQAKLRNAYDKARGNQKKRDEIRKEFRALQRRKDKFRPFFHNARSALRRTPITSLYRVRKSRIKTARERSRELGY